MAIIQQQITHIESSPVWDTSFLAELIYDGINRQFIHGAFPKPVTIQYLHELLV